MDKDKQQVCSIRIIFPVETDDQALDLKKKIMACLDDKPEAIVQFSINSGPGERFMKA